MHEISGTLKIADSQGPIQNETSQLKGTFENRLTIPNRPEITVGDISTDSVLSVKDLNTQTNKATSAKARRTVYEFKSLNCGSATHPSRIYDTVSSNLRNASSNEFPSMLKVVRWEDPFIDKVGYEADGEYVELFYLNILGPSSLFLLRFLVKELLKSREHVDIDLDILSFRLGLNSKTSKKSLISRSLKRSISFGMIRRISHDTFAVRLYLPQLSLRQRQRFPQSLNLEHDNYVKSHATKGLRR